MRTFGLVLLLVFAATAMASAQVNFPFTSRNLQPGTIVVSQPAFGPQQIFIFDGKSLQIVTPYVNQVAQGGYQMSGPPGVIGRDARGFPVMGAPGFYPPQTTASFHLYGGPVITIPNSRVGVENGGGRLVLTGPGFSPIPPGSTNVNVFNFRPGRAVWSVAQP